MDLCMSAITCQKAGGMIYRQRSIMKRPGLVNENSMFVGYGSFFSTSSHLFSLSLCHCLCLLGSLEVSSIYEPYDSKFTTHPITLVTLNYKGLSHFLFTHYHAFVA